MANSAGIRAREIQKILQWQCLNHVFDGGNGFNAINQKHLGHPNLEVVKLLLFFNIQIVYLY